MRLFSCYLLIQFSIENTCENIEIVGQCPVSKQKWQERSTYIKCVYPKVYHCISVSQFKATLAEMCLIERLISPADGCPFIDIESGLFEITDYFKCTQQTGCPKNEVFLSNELYRYPACLWSDARINRISNETYPVNFTNFKEYTTNISPYNMSIKIDETGNAIVKPLHFALPVAGIVAGLIVLAISLIIVGCRMQRFKIPRNAAEVNDDNSNVPREDPDSEYDFLRQSRMIMDIEL